MESLYLLPPKPHLPEPRVSFAMCPVPHFSYQAQTAPSRLPLSAWSLLQSL
jgi:hypothetical protein